MNFSKLQKAGLESLLIGVLAIAGCRGCTTENRYNIDVNVHSKAEAPAASQKVQEQLVCTSRPVPVQIDAGKRFYSEEGLAFPIKDGLHTKVEECYTNAAQNLSAASYTNPECKISQVRLPTGLYVFMPLTDKDKILDCNGNQIPRQSLFPFAAVQANEMTEHVNPAGKIIYGRKDKKVRLFVESSFLFSTKDKKRKLEFITTDRTFRAYYLPQNEFVGQVQTSDFRIPAVNFSPHTKAVPYAKIKDTEGCWRLVFAHPNPTFRLNHDTKDISYFADNFYIETLGFLQQENPEIIKAEPSFIQISPD
jgi:hypothetical protein